MDCMKILVLEALAGMFEIGQLPTGDRDPFGLRRAALGVIRILIERKRRLSLSRLVDIAFGANTTLAYTDAGNNTGTLTVTDGTNTANIALLGQYVAADFALSAFGGGTLITDPPSNTTNALVNPHA